jgi:hypothetical protein
VEKNHILKEITIRTKRIRTLFFENDGEDKNYNVMRKKRMPSPI